MINNNYDPIVKPRDLRIINDPNWNFATRPTFVQVTSFDLWHHTRYRTLSGCFFAMVVISILSHTEFGRNDHREDAPLFIKSSLVLWALFMFYFTFYLKFWSCQFWHPLRANLTKTWIVCGGSFFSKIIIFQPHTLKFIKIKDTTVILNLFCPKQFSITNTMAIPKFSTNSGFLN